MKRIEKICTLEQAENYQHYLYTIYDHVRLVRFPTFEDKGLHVWEVKN
jgi:hypothetical protein